MAANYAATATTSQRPHLNSTRSSADGVVRTKILLLGLRRSVFCLFCHAVDSVPQSWKNIHPAVSLQQHATQSNVLSRDNNAHNEARYRVCSVVLPSSLPPDGRLPLARSSRSKYGIVLQTPLSNRLAFLWRSFLQLYSSLTSVYVYSFCVSDCLLETLTGFVQSTHIQARGVHHRVVQ